MENYIDKKAQGKRNRRIGAEFERAVRRDMNYKGWIIDKFTSNIELENMRIVQAKSNRWNSRSCGFPDFVIFRKLGELFEVRFIECKTNNILSKPEKLKLDFLVKKGFRTFVAFKEGKNIKYREFFEYKPRGK